MSDQETQVDPKIVARAESMGWVPQERFRGDTAKWVDAHTFVERGEQFLPILQANNRRLQENFNQTTAEVQRLTKLLEGSQESIAELKKFHDESSRAQVEATRTKLLAELKAAKKDGDTDLEVDLTDELSRVNTALAKEPKKEEKKEEPAAKGNDVDPAFVAWQARPENSWFGKDSRKTSLAISIAQELRANGERSLGEVFYDKVAEEVADYLGSKKKGEEEDEGRPASKVNSSRGGGGNGGGNGTSYKDLPSDAKAVCEAQAATMAGEGRAFKTKAEWQGYYATEFFKSKG